MSQKKTTPKKKKTEVGGVLPKVELIAIFIFFLSFTIWAMSKCSSTQAQYEQEATEDATQASSATTPNKAIETPVEKTPKTPTSETTIKPKAPVKVPPEKITILYVVLDGLKLRKGPHLDSTVVRTLKIDSEVYFLNEVTDFKQEINLGDRVAIEPWVKVRAYTGHEGWVYGAGINYFKPKLITDTISN